MIGTWLKEAFAQTFRRFFTMWGLVLLTGLLTIVAAVLMLFAPYLAIPVTVILGIGLDYAFLRKVDGQHVNGGMLFEGFQKPFRIAGGGLWKTLWIGIWGVIPIAGVFIALFWKKL